MTELDQLLSSTSNVSELGANLEASKSYITPLEHEENRQASSDRLQPFIEEEYDRTDDPLLGGLANVAMNIAETVDNITPGEMFNPQERNLRNLKREYNNANIGMNHISNPYSTPVAEFTSGMAPYLLAGPAYGAGIKAGTAGATSLFGNNMLGRTVGSYAGSAPVTMGVGMGAHHMDVDDAFKSTAFDALLAPIIATQTKNLGGDRYKRPPRGNGIDPNRPWEPQPTPPQVGNSPMERSLIGSDSSFTGTSRSQRGPGPMPKDPEGGGGPNTGPRGSTFDVEPIPGTERSMTIGERITDIFNPERAKPIKNPVSKDMHIAPKENQPGEIKDQIDRNNLDTAILKRDLDEVFANVKGLGKQNKHIQKDIEHAMIKGTMPRSVQAQKVLGELLAMPRYRDNTLSFIPHNIAQKLHTGAPLTDKDKEYLANNSPFLNEKQKAQIEVMEDIESLKSSATPFDTRIELMNKYGDTETVAITPEFKELLRANPEALKYQLQITLDNIKNITGFKQALNESSSARGGVLSDEKYIPDEEYDALGERIGVKTIPADPKQMSKKDREAREINAEMEAGLDARKKAKIAATERGDTPDVRPKTKATNTIAPEQDSKLVDPKKKELKPLTKAERIAESEKRNKGNANTPEARQATRIAKGKSEANIRNRSMSTLTKAVDRATTKEQLDLLVKKSLPLKHHNRYEKFKNKVIAKREKIKDKPKTEPVTEKEKKWYESAKKRIEKGQKPRQSTLDKIKDIESRMEKPSEKPNRAPDSRTQGKAENPYYKATRSDTQGKVPKTEPKTDEIVEPEVATDTDIEKMITDNREYINKEPGKHEPIHGEAGAESLEYEHSLNNPATKPHAESTRLFTKPQKKDKDRVSAGYFANDIFMNTQMDNGKGFSVYVHESFHKILSEDPHLSQMEKSFRKDYANDNIPEVAVAYNHIYLGQNDFTRYEESIIMVAADMFTQNLPNDVKERLGYTESLTRSQSKYKDLTPDMRKLAMMLHDKAQTALDHKGNELNQYAYGTDETTFRTLDRIGYDALSAGIDKVLPELKKIEQKAADYLDSKNYKFYNKTRAFADELYANVMSQTSTLPAQEFIDKYTAIARSAEERARNVANTVSGSVQELFPERGTREALTPILMRKDVSSIKTEYNDAANYNEFVQAKNALEASLKPYTGFGIDKLIKQTVRGLTSQEGMNSPHWKPNARSILINNPKFRQDMQNNPVKEHIDNMDKFLSMEAITKKDFDYLKSLDQNNLNGLIDILKTATGTAKSVMGKEVSNYIKGYKPSLFKNNIEFSDAPEDLGKKGSQWKALDAKGSLYYREALPIEHIEGMMPSKNQMAKGRVDFDKIQGEENIIKYAEEFGYGIATIGGKMKLRKIMSDKTRREILVDNNDIAENLASMFEQTVHNKTTRDAHEDMAIGLNRNGLITGKRPFDDKYSKMTKEELRMLPRELRQDLIKMHKGADNIYISKKYKEQMIGANLSLSAIKHLEKSGIEITHGMLLAEAKVLDMLGEATSIIKQKIILNNPVVVTGNLMYGNVIAKMEGATWKDLKQFQKEAVIDFNEYTKLKEQQIKLYIKGGKDTPEYKKITTRLENNLAYKLFAEGDNTASGIDRNLLIKAVRESNLGKKHMEQAFTDLLGGPDKFGYKLASELFMTPQSIAGSFFIKALNYVDYMNRSTLMRTYMKQGLSFEEAARKANSKTVSFSKRLPSHFSVFENKGGEYFLGWALRNGVGVTKSFLEHPASWATFLAVYMMLSEEDPSKHDARYIGDVRVSSFNPAESLTDGWLDGGIYASMIEDGAYAFEPALHSKVLAGKNPVITTRD